MKIQHLLAEDNAPLQRLQILLYEADLGRVVSAVELGRPLVTRNVRHFRAVSGLAVITY